MIREIYGNNVGIWNIYRISWQLEKVVRLWGCIRTAVRTNFRSWSESWSYQYEHTLPYQTTSTDACMRLSVPYTKYDTACRSHWLYAHDREMTAAYVRRYILYHTRMTEKWPQRTFGAIFCFLLLSLVVSRTTKTSTYYAFSSRPHKIPLFTHSHTICVAVSRHNTLLSKENAHHVGRSVSMRVVCSWASLYEPNASEASSGPTVYTFGPTVYTREATFGPTVYTREASFARTVSSPKRISTGMRWQSTNKLYSYFNVKTNEVRYSITNSSCHHLVTCYPLVTCYHLLATWSTLLTTNFQFLHHMNTGNNSNFRTFLLQFSFDHLEVFAYWFYTLL